MKHRIEIPISFDSFNKKNLKFVMSKDTGNVFPSHDLMKNCCFPFSKSKEGDIKSINQIEAREEIEATLEANLADAMSRVAEIYGVDANELRHIFPAVLRMLKSNSEWSK